MHHKTAITRVTPSTLVRPIASVPLFPSPPSGTSLLLSQSCGNHRYKATLSQRPKNTARSKRIIYWGLYPLPFPILLTWNALSC